MKLIYGLLLAFGLSSCIAPDGGFTVTASGTTAASESTAVVAPTTQGVDVYLLNGQSNAITYFYNAMIDSAMQKGKPFRTAHHWKSGHQMLHWIDEYGNKGFLWPLMMQTYFSEIDSLLAAGESISKIHLIQFQGESDVANYQTQQALTDDVDSVYVGKLRMFINNFQSEIFARYGVTAVISIAKIGFNENHQTFVDVANLTSHSVTKIRNEIQKVADEFATVRAFETDDLSRRDWVHLDYYPSEGVSMKTATDRALSLFD